MPAAARLALLVPLSLATAAQQQIWFCPLDPLFRAEVNYGGSPEYMNLFTPTAPWIKAAAHVNVFKIYPQWIGAATDADLQVQFADLQRRGIALALEYGVLTAPAECGKGVEGFGGQNLLNAALRIQRNGGTLRYVAMDEPIYFSTLYTGANACRWTVDQMAANAASNIRAMWAQFPNVDVGDIEPFPVAAAGWLPQYRAGIQAFRRALGVSLAFFDSDVNWTAPTYLADLAAVRDMAAAEAVPFGIIYDGDPSDSSDAQWIQSAVRHMVSAESTIGAPGLVIFQSWHAYPKKLLPETDSDAFTSLIDAYFRRRAALTSSIAGSTLRGALIAADTGQPIANAAIQVSVTSTGREASPAVYTLSGTVPDGTQRIVFGARVNLECACSGAADFRVSAFTLDAGAGGVLSADFAKGLTGWGVSPTAAYAKVEGAALHIVAGPAQSVLLNSAPVPFTGSGPYTFRVNAQVVPKSAGSGYFTLVFLDAAKEISRVRILLSGPTTSLPAVSTDAAGRFTVPLPGSDDFVQSTYDGNTDFWPAQSTLNVIKVRQHR